jgi:lipoprotein-anchoring transpeptidase ErfK/SrfK
MTGRRLAVFVAAATLLVTACGDGRPATGPAGSASAAPGAGLTQSTVPPRTATLRRAVSRAASSLVVHAEPQAESAVVARLKPRTPLGSPTVLLAVSSRPGWVKVELPVRPNGSTGWVAAADLRLEPVPGEIDVDLSTRRIRVVLGARVLADTTVAIGSAQNPTPTGRFFVTDRVRPDRPDGPYGTFALGLSAHSDTLSEFAGADGQVGIHGTNAPRSIGQAVSHGCIRVPATAAGMLAKMPLGTPVVIR